MAMNKDFGGFELKEKIGSGGMASVYLAVQKSLNRPVVLKILYPHLAEDEKLVQRFEREARAAAMMRHPNIIQVIDCGRHEDVAYIAMEFVEGMDLKKWIDANGAPPIEMALLMLRDVCAGLEHAHSHRIVHRDIKPANIMFTPDGTIKIMDFGLARSGAETSTQMTMVGSVMGTPAYMSPEQATGEAVDERSDIFSTGVVAYELLGGTRPFEGDSYSTVLRSILTVEPMELTQFNPLVPEDVARIVRGMLQKDMGKRTQTITQVRESLEDVIESTGLHRGKDLLREYALDPKAVATKWRQKRLSRHLDQGLYFENMGLGKIDDALLEFRRVLHLDPGNSVARDHVKKLEREREAVIANATPPPEKDEPGQDATMMLTPEQTAAIAAAVAAFPAKGASAVPSTPAAPAAPKSEPPKAAQPARPAPAAKAPPPPKPPAPRPASPAKSGGKGGLPVPLIAGIGLLVVAAIVAGIFMLGGKKKNDAVTDSGTGTTTTAPETPAATPTLPPPATPAPAPAAASDGSPLAAAQHSFDAGDYIGATNMARKALAAKGVGRDDKRTANELIARSTARGQGAAPGAQAFVRLLRMYPAYKPDPSFTPAERGAYETAKLNLAGGTQPAPTTVRPPEGSTSPPTASATGTVNVKVTPFAESFTVDGAVVDKNKPRFTAALKPGSHKIGVRHPTLGAKEWTVQAAAGETIELSHDFTAAAGSVTVSSEPTWGEIYVDGVRIGHNTPWDVSPISPGRHEITLVRDGYAPEGGAQTVEVKTGESKTVRFKLKKK
jgi:serine/threonine protein kinase